MDRALSAVSCYGLPGRLRYGLYCRRCRGLYCRMHRQHGQAGSLLRADRRRCSAGESAYCAPSRGCWKIRLGGPSREQYMQPLAAERSAASGMCAERGIQANATVAGCPPAYRSLPRLCLPYPRAGDQSRRPKQATDVRPCTACSEQRWLSRSSLWFSAALDPQLSSIAGSVFFLN